MVAKQINPQFVAQSPAIASYDYNDLSEGTGNVVFYMAQTENSVGEDQILTNQTLYSATIEERYAIQSTDNFGSDVVDLDFDLTSFNAHKTVKGTAVINAGLYFNGQASEKAWGYVKFKIIHYDGTTETTLGTVQTETYFKNDATPEYYTLLMPVSLTTKRFKPGDILRLNMAYRCSGSGTGGVGDLVVGTDPQNRDGTYCVPSSENIITSSRVIVPFKLET